MPSASLVRRTYYLLTAGNTLAGSLIWGINTIFLLDAGLSNLAAFAANACFTAGMVLFEVPTGIVADLWGRRASFLLGTVTLAVTTGLYVWLWHVHAPFWPWAAVSLLIGLGFTFFSGAVEAWLVDALAATGDDGPLEAVFARGQVVSGAAMLTGSVAGGYLAQLTDLGVPFLVRAGVYALMCGLAAALMRDVGFTPDRSLPPLARMRRIAGDSVRYGWRARQVRLLMLAAPFTGGVGVYVFYALQPHLLDLYDDAHAYGVAGVAAAAFAAAQITGGLLAGRIGGLFAHRLTAYLALTAAGVVALAGLGLAGRFWVALTLVVLWALLGAAAMPLRQAYVNGLIPSPQRATILSFDSLMTSTGGVAAQPALGRAADVWGYPVSFLISAALSACALPFLVRARAGTPAAPAAPPPRP
ncbi:MFS transporter [Dactylosporangium aurantiacum]|uniref:MFS transporter n=1 Tax=Dactylosporangium aurantiacum TaxID=35754 RepID=A0A9Q9IJM6_9ACTN|nr:MFS transporter [Dactylosporangium aurantiacum]MDG6104151.1 MFS transporter [Dactylosporangium aurantiacum]UWZ56841.1 MFS transporter [Dactylosporangium aurantiacum]